MSDPPNGVEFFAVPVPGGGIAVDAQTKSYLLGSVLPPTLDYRHVPLLLPHTSSGRGKIAGSCTGRQRYLCPLKILNTCLDRRSCAVDLYGTDRIELKKITAKHQRLMS